MTEAHVLTRIPAYRLGLLEPPVALETREHLRGCEACRAAFEPFTETTAEEETRFGHLPIALLVRWDTFAPHLSEGERACLDDHLDACARCRDSLSFARDLRVRAQERPAPARRSWLGFGTAAMAAVIAVAVVVLRERPAPRPGPRPVQVAAPAPAAPSDVRAAAVSLKGIDRGAGPLVVRVAAEATVLPIRVPPLLGVAPDARLTITVAGPGGVELGHAAPLHRELFGAASRPAVEAHGPLTAGRYRVSVAGGGESATYDFELVKNP